MGIVSSNLVTLESYKSYFDMKQRVVLSNFSVISSVLSIALFVFLLFFNNPPVSIQLLLAVLLVGMLMSGLFYMPLSISADKYAIYVNRSLKVKAILMQDVESVRLCPPTMGAIRICGSGGFFGYWGWFRERDLGKYFAYYGRSSDCFLVVLKDGRKYMLGCQNPQQMVSFIESAIGRKS